MIADGLFRDFPVGAVFALHNWPALPLGACVALDGAMMAAAGTFDIEVRARGAHGRMPHEGIDPIPAACAVVAGLQTIASRNVSPTKSAVVSATQIHGGDVCNVIPDACRIQGTARWFDREVGRLIADRLRALTEATATAYGCVGSSSLTVGLEPTINDPAAARLIREVAVSRGIGLDVRDADPSMAGEDFCFMLGEVAGCYLWLGSAREGGSPGLHSPLYDFNDELIPLGTALWTNLVHRTLGPTSA